MKAKTFDMIKSLMVSCAQGYIKGAEIIQNLGLGFPYSQIIPMGMCITEGISSLSEKNRRQTAVEKLIKELKQQGIVCKVTEKTEEYCILECYEKKRET